MKHIRKLIASLTALALLLSFGMTALAANPSAGDMKIIFRVPPGLYALPRKAGL